VTTTTQRPHNVTHQRSVRYTAELHVQKTTNLERPKKSVLQKLTNSNQTDIKLSTITVATE